MNVIVKFTLMCLGRRLDTCTRVHIFHGRRSTHGESINSFGVMKEAP
jgi:hypothetical protein